MLIYGVALLATCLVIGMLVGQALGAALGIDANVGGRHRNAPAGHS